MTNLFKSDAIRTLASIAGALMLSTTFIVAAVGPAKAAVPAAAVTTAPVAY